MNFRIHSRPNSNNDEAERAEMLEIYTRWLKGEKLSRKQMRILKASQECLELEPLKQIIDFAHYRFRESERITPRPGAKQRVANELMKRIGFTHSDESSTPMDGLRMQPAYSMEGIGSDSELAFSPTSSGFPPPLPETVDPFCETVILDGEKVERVTSPSVEKEYNLKLRVVQGDEVGREYNIAFLELLMGRGVEATIQLDANPAASRQHARLTVDGDTATITDLGSGNGTYVDGVRIAETTPLHAGAKVTIGKQSFEVTEIQQDAGNIRLSFKEIEGSNVGQVYTVHVKEMTVGRGSAARIRFADATGTLSRLHARFDLKNGEVYITDLSSKNGTYVNGIRIEEPVALSKDAVIKLGGVICEVIDIEHS